MPPCFSAAHLKENKYKFIPPLSVRREAVLFHGPAVISFPCAGTSGSLSRRCRTANRSQERSPLRVRHNGRLSGGLRLRRCRRSDVSCFPVYKSNGEGIAPRMGSRDIARDGISADSVGCCKNRIRACRNGGFGLRRLCRLIVDDVRGIGIGAGSRLGRDRIRRVIRGYAAAGGRRCHLHESIVEILLLLIQLAVIVAGCAVPLSRCRTGGYMTGVFRRIRHEGRGLLNNAAAFGCRKSSGRFPGGFPGRFPGCFSGRFSGCLSGRFSYRAVVVFVGFFRKLRKSKQEKTCPGNISRRDVVLGEFSSGTPC